MSIHQGLMNLEIEFEFEETQPARPVGRDSSGQAVEPASPPEWEVCSFTLGGVEVTMGRQPLTEVVEAIFDAIEAHIGYNYQQLTDDRRWGDD